MNDLNDMLCFVQTGERFPLKTGMQRLLPKFNIFQVPLRQADDAMPKQENLATIITELPGSETELVDDYELIAGGDLPEITKPRSNTLQATLNRTERASAEEEQALFTRLNFLTFRKEALETSLEGGDRPKKTLREINRLAREIEATRNAIAEKFLRLLASIARKLSPSTQDYDDYFSEGTTVLFHAIEKFDPSRGFRFSTYATHAVQRHLIRYSRRRSKQQKREIAADMSFRCDTPDESPNHDLTHEEAAAATELLLEQIHSALDDREREIVVGRFGLDEDASGKSFQAIGDYMGLSKERVRQLYNRAIQKLGQSVQPQFS